MKQQKMLQKKTEQKYIYADSVFFAIGITLLIPMLFAGIWFSRNDYLVLQEVTQCIIKDKTSIPCPGCGGTRACCLLFQGHLIASFFMHPSVLIGAAEYLHFLFLYIFRNWICKTKKEIQLSCYVYIFLGVTLVQWLAKLVINW